MILSKRETALNKRYFYKLLQNRKNKGTSIDEKQGNKKVFCN